MTRPYTSAPTQAASCFEGRSAVFTPRLGALLRSGCKKRRECEIVCLFPCAMASKASPLEGLLKTRTKRRKLEENGDAKQQHREGSPVENEICADVGPRMELPEDQKIRMELNKAAAQATRNLRLCQNNVALAASVEGLRFPAFKDLLVDKSWLDVMERELAEAYAQKLHEFLDQELAGKVPIYPPIAQVFNAFNSCPFTRVKVVILGQDPYHGPGQAMGLCFSVAKGIKLPSSLVNIFKEIQDDVGCTFPSHGNLEKWAYQGVLLLNTILTVREAQANSHTKKGWESFTDAAIAAVSRDQPSVVFLLWGNSAQEKTKLIDANKHHILKAAHPSGLSANRGFFKCRHFSQTNKLLEKQGLLPIDWQI